MRIAIATLAVLAAGVGPADEGDVHLLCPLVVEQQRVDIDEVRLDIELADSYLAATEQILGLVEELREDDAIERFVYLRARHDRDVAAVQVKRQRLRLKREEAILDSYVTVCSPLDDGESADDRRARRAAAEATYRQAECHRIGKDLAIAELDLAYLEELLASARDLSANRAASKLDVIDAEQKVEAARIRVEAGARRVEACVASGAAAGDGS